MLADVALSHQPRAGLEVFPEHGGEVAVTAEAEVEREHAQTGFAGNDSRQRHLQTDTQQILMQRNAGLLAEDVGQMER
jgi:hypothetical protein